MTVSVATRRSRNSMSSRVHPAASAAVMKRSSMIAWAAICWPRMPSMMAETSARSDV